MPRVVNNRVRRTILNATETTTSTQSINSDALAFVFTTSDNFYVGFHHTFSSLYVDMGTANTNSATLTVEFWNGSAWTAVDDLLDATAGMTADGFISWINPGSWQKSSQTGIDTDIELYFLRIQTSDNFSAGTTISSILNLFSDDNLLRLYYPELVSDSRWLPPSRTDFLEQHYAAKNMVVNRLLQRQEIREEGQVQDINQVAVAAVHACAWIIMNPVARSEESAFIADRAFREFEKEIQAINVHADLDDDGIVSDAERERVFTSAIVRR